MNDKTSVDLNSDQSWAMARRHAAFLSPIPNSVSYSIQTLWANQLSAPPGESVVAITPESFAALRRVDRTAKLKAPIYFAAQALFPDAFSTMQEDDTSDALLRILGPGLFASFLGMIYLHRRLSRICDATGWETLSKELVLNMELGYRIGCALPALGPAHGALLGGIRYAALATFLIRSPEIYMRYRNKFKKQFDYEYENQQWGCDHSQICAYLVKDLGFTKDIIEMAIVFRKEDLTNHNISAEMGRWRAGLIWIDSIKDGECPPKDTAAIQTLKAGDTEIVAVEEQAGELFKIGSTFSWMLKKFGSDKDTEPQTD